MSIAASVLFGDSNENMFGYIGSSDEEEEQFSKKLKKQSKKQMTSKSSSKQNVTFKTETASEVLISSSKVNTGFCQTQTDPIELVVPMQQSGDFIKSEEEAVDSPDSVIADIEIIDSTNKEYAFKIPNESYLQRSNDDNDGDDDDSSPLLDAHDILRTFVGSIGVSSNGDEDEDDCSVSSTESPPFPELSFLSEDGGINCALNVVSMDQQRPESSSTESLYQEMMNVGKESSQSQSQYQNMFDLPSQMKYLSVNEAYINEKLDSLMATKLVTKSRAEYSKQKCENVANFGGKLSHVSSDVAPHVSMTNNTTVAEAALSTSPNITTEKDHYSAVASHNTFQQQPFKISGQVVGHKSSNKLKKKKSSKSDPVALFHAVEKKRIKDKQALEAQRRKKAQQARLEEMERSQQYNRPATYEEIISGSHSSQCLDKEKEMHGMVVERKQASSKKVVKPPLSAWAQGEIGPPGAGLTLVGWEGGLRRKTLPGDEHKKLNKNSRKGRNQSFNGEGQQGGGRSTLSSSFELLDSGRQEDFMRRSAKPNMHSINSRTFPEVPSKHDENNVNFSSPVNVDQTCDISRDKHMNSSSLTDHHPDAEHYVSPTKTSKLRESGLNKKSSFQKKETVLSSPTTPPRRAWH